MEAKFKFKEKERVFTWGGYIPSRIISRHNDNSGNYYYIKNIFSKGRDRFSEDGLIKTSDIAKYNIGDIVIVDNRLVCKIIDIVNANPVSYRVGRNKKESFCVQEERLKNVV